MLTITFHSLSCSLFKLPFAHFFVRTFARIRKYLYDGDGLGAVKKKLTEAINKHVISLSNWSRDIYVISALLELVGYRPTFLVWAIPFLCISILKCLSTKTLIFDFQPSHFFFLLFLSLFIFVNLGDMLYNGIKTKRKRWYLLRLSSLWKQNNKV